MLRTMLSVGLLVFSCATNFVWADVSRIQVDRREPLAEGHRFGNAGAYDVIAGRLFFETDPTSPANRRVADLDLAPVNAQGKVESWADFFLLTPANPAKANGCLLVDIHNRGNKLALWVFNDGEGSNNPSTLAHTGNGFLLEQGYTILWTGWSGEIADDGTDRLLGGLPIATQKDGSPITGPTWVEMIVNEPVQSREFAWSPWGVAKAYPAASLDNTTATLTMREYRGDEPTEIPHDQWAFARAEGNDVIPDPTSLYVKDGLKPGWLYDLTYTAKEPRVAGLGLTGLRDAISFFRYAQQENPEQENAEQENPVAGVIDRATIFGVSQSGRVVNHFLYEGWNSDAQGRIVFDGALIHVPGAGKGMFNHRFGLATTYGAQHQGALFPSEFFPFAPTPQTDPITGQQGESLARLRESGHVPKIFYVQTASEYWERGASLLHTDVEGKRDMSLDPSTRLYHIAGAGHLGAMPPQRGQSQNLRNPLRHRGPVLRALLTALDAWIADGTQPPESRYPRIDDGTLVDLETWRSQFPKIPGVSLPENHYQPRRLNPGPEWHTKGIATIVPPEAGPAYRTLVPAVDEDGNEVAGIRLPEIAVPRATYTGWNLRSPEAGAPKSLDALQGSYFPFPATKAEREKTGDPRHSIEERYPSQADYVSNFAKAVLQLHEERFLLAEDAIEMIGHATKREVNEAD